VSLEIRDFLERFFGDGNRLKLPQENSRNSETSAFLAPWIARLKKRLPTVLPCARDAGTDWYGIAFSERQFRGLREDLTAFVGSTRSTFRGQRVTLDLNDPVEAAVYELTQGNAFKFEGIRNSTGNSVELRNALSMMVKVLDRQPSGLYRSPRATGRVLGDFYTALRVGDRTTAERELQYLRHHNRLDTLNLLFLKVQMLSELQAWQEMLRLPELADLLRVRRSSAVTQAIIQAVYQCELSHFELTSAARSAVTFFHESILPRYHFLYGNRASSHLPEVVKSLMLLAVGAETPDPALRDELLAVPGLGAGDLVYLQNLAKLLPDPLVVTAPVTSDPLEAAIEAAQSGNYDRTVALLGNYPPSPQTVGLLLAAAYELQTLGTERLALQAFDRLTDRERNEILASRRQRTFLESLTGKPLALTETTADLVPTNWLEWLSILGQNPAWERALHSATQGAQEWMVTDLLEKPGAIAQFVSLQAVVAAKAQEPLQNAFPHLLRSFQQDPQFPRREFLPIYTALLDNLALGIISMGGGESHLTLFNEFITLLLTIGVDAEQYGDLVDYGLEFWREYQSPSTIDWGLDLVNILVLYPCPDRDRRSQLLFKIAETFRTFFSRIDDAQWSVFNALARDLKLETSFSDLMTEAESTREESTPRAEDIFSNLQHQSILLYTLTEPAAQRVKSFLEGVCEGVTVHLSHDKGGNDRLRQWVKNDDLVIIVTTSAKHAATEFIENHRPHQRPLLLLNSKGSAGILRGIREYLGI
jgi:hypothetical protein